LEDECHCLDLELAKRNITHPDDTTTFATYASSLHQRASLQEEKDRLSNLIATINQVITYLALNLPNPESAMLVMPNILFTCFEVNHYEFRQGSLLWQ